MKKYSNPYHNYKYSKLPSTVIIYSPQPKQIISSTKKCFVTHLKSSNPQPGKDPL